MKEYLKEFIAVILLVIAFTIVTAFVGMLLKIILTPFMFGWNLLY